MSEREPDADIERTLAGARRAEPSWTAGRQQQLKWSLMARLDEQRHPFAPAVVLASVAVVVVVAGVAWHQLARRSAARPGAGGQAPLALDRPLPRLADGSSIVLDGPSATLKTLRESSDEVVVQLETGGAHFEVARRPSRIFRVQAGPVTVQVIGTRFHVRRDGARTRVSVDRGRVLASWWGGSRELGPGEQGTFPPEGVALDAPVGEALAPRATAEDEVTHEMKAAESPAPAPATPAPTAAVVTRRAFAAGAAVRSAAPMTPEALFALADRARASGRPDAAVAHLREIVERYPGDPHAPMAAFTEGRLLLEALAHPRQAAAAFERARALAKGGPLAEDALAREVESLHAAGDTVAAHDRAVRYRELYPRGPRLGTVTRFGGLQAAP